MLTAANTGTTIVPAIVRSILWIDCSGGIFVGVLMLVFADWLPRLYQLPSSLYYAIATANLGYGAFALVLALRRTRQISLVSTLAIANAIWGGICLIAAVSMFGSASIFGVTHILAECVVVFWLAQLEWRHRALIAIK